MSAKRQCASMTCNPRRLQTATILRAVLWNMKNEFQDSSRKIQVPKGAVRIQASEFGYLGISDLGLHLEKYEWSLVCADLKKCSPTSIRGLDRVFYARKSPAKKAFFTASMLGGIAK